MALFGSAEYHHLISTTGDFETMHRELHSVPVRYRTMGVQEGQKSVPSVVSYVFPEAYLVGHFGERRYAHDCLGRTEAGVKEMVGGSDIGTPFKHGSAGRTCASSFDPIASKLTTSG